MKVILLKDVSKVGRKGESVEVSNGYAENALFPKKLAVPTNSPEAKKILANLETKKKNQTQNIEKISNILKTISNEKIIVNKKANEKGHLFDSFDIKEMFKIIEDNFKVTLSEKNIEKHKDMFPIKTLGEYIIPINVNQEKFKIKISLEKI